jgi:hypothetical protein
MPFLLRMIYNFIKMKVAGNWADSKVNVANDFTSC